MMRATAGARAGGVLAAKPGRRAALVLGLVGAAAASSLSTPARAADNPYDRVLRRQLDRLTTLRGRPEAIAPLAVLSALVDDLPPAAIEGAFRSVADDAAADPLVAAQASAALADLVEQRGAAAEADKRRVALGLLSHPWVVGPFGDGRQSLAQAFPPEGESGAIDPRRTYAGKERAVSWRAGVSAVRQGALMVDGLLRPDSETAAYVAWAVSSDSPREGVLRLGTVGPFKVWINGRLGAARDVVRTASLDQDAVAIRLRRGTNRILLKTVVTDGAWRVFVRLTDGMGRTLAVREDDPTRAQDALPPSSNVPVARGGHTALRALEPLLRARATQAAAGPGGAQAWLDLAQFLIATTPSDRDARDDVAALEQSIALGPSVAALSALADVGRDDDERRRALDRAAALAANAGDDDARADGALVQAKLGDVAKQQHRDAVAVARWRQALQTDAGCWPAAVALAEEEQSAGLSRASTARLEALPVSLRAVRRLGLALVRQWEAVERRADADKLLAELAHARQGDPEIAHQLSLRARQRGETTEAIAALSSPAQQRPDLPSLTIDLARLVEGSGDGTQAVALLTELCTRLPDDAAAEAALGKLLFRLGRRQDARQRLAMAVARKPQDAALRRYVERAASGDEQSADQSKANEDLGRRYAADPLTLIPASWRAGAAIGEKQAGLAADPAVVLLDRRVVRVHRNGLADTFAQRVVAIATDHGAEDNKEFLVRYQPGDEDVEIRQARIYRRLPGGDVQILQAGDRDDRDLSEPWYGLYYDQRASVVRFEGLRAGDVLDVQYSITDLASENELADYFGDLQFLGETIPKQRWDYTLVGPKSRAFHTNTPRTPTLTTTTTEEGDEQILRFAAHDLPKIEVEPAMPGFAEVTPYLHVSTYASWADVGAWYWRLIADQLASDETLRQAARGAVGRATTDREKVRAIHALVLTGTRYVGLEFGIHGFKPYKVTQVLSRRFGDCKDKASLMVALLRAVGVDAQLVLLRTRRAGRIDTQPASLAVFDHAIVYVPKLGTYLDGTAEFSGMDELPNQDQGVMGLRVGAAGAQLIETPVLSSSHNLAQRQWAIDLDSSGQARIDETLSIAGQAAADWREHYQTPGERLDRYSKVWTAGHPGAVLAKVEMPGLEDRNRPVVVRAQATVPRLGEPYGDHELAVPITARESDFTRAYARLSTRTQELIIAYPWQHEEEMIFHLPPSLHVAHLPTARTVTSDFGCFRLDVSTDASGRVHVRSALDVTGFRLTAAEYPRFRQFLGAIDAVLADRLVVRTDPS
ncbi:MAG TPA: DUF3857 domain-containing protein [Polyangia bacterium]|jgi:tetratricopeptide (TPR) repeat protein|nr:DUF3857 domain-containing protein [Polyangia bacterium]